MALKAQSLSFYADFILRNKGVFGEQKLKKSRDNSEIPSDIRNIEICVFRYIWAYQAGVAERFKVEHDEYYKNYPYYVPCHVINQHFSRFQFL